MREQADAAPDGVRVVDDIVSKDASGPAGGPKQGRDDAQERCLAAPVSAEDGDRFAALDCEARAPEDPAAAKAPGDGRQLDGRRLGGGRGDQKTGRDGDRLRRLPPRGAECLVDVTRVTLVLRQPLAPLGGFCGEQPAVVAARRALVFR